MSINYDKLWKLLIDKKMNRTALKESAGISFNVLAKMGKGEAVSMESMLLSAAVDMNIIQKSGSWYSMGETRLAQGEANVRAMLETNAELRENIERQVKAGLGLVEADAKPEGRTDPAPKSKSKAKAGETE